MEAEPGAGQHSRGNLEPPYIPPQSHLVSHTGVCPTSEPPHVPPQSVASQSYCLSHPGATIVQPQSHHMSYQSLSHLRHTSCPMHSLSHPTACPTPDTASPEPPLVPTHKLSHPMSHVMAFWGPAQCMAGRGGHGCVALRAQGHSAGDTKGQPQPHTAHTQP